MDELIKKVQIWAEDRNLISGATPKTQIIKLMAILAAQHNTTMHNCMANAYEKIKDRQGVILDGVLIHDTDPQYQVALALLANRHQGAQT